jgi:CheY-like chemotaxis protein
MWQALHSSALLTQYIVTSNELMCFIHCILTRNHTSLYRKFVKKMERVICIDDDPLCLLLAEVVLKQSNVTNEIHLAESGPAALSLLNRIHSTGQQASQDLSTLIFLDLNMPVMNGWEFLDAFNKDYQHLCDRVKIVILTSSIDTADIIKSRQYKIVSDYISKPITAEVLNKLKSGIAA